MLADVSLDTSALTDAVDRTRLHAYRESLPARVRPALAAIWSPAIILVVASVFLAGFFVWLLTVDGPPNGDDLVVIIGVVVVAAAVTTVSAVQVAGELRSRSGVRQFRLARYAAANRLHYEAVSGPLGLPGMIFGDRDRQVSYDVVRGGGTGDLIVGNQTFTVGEGKNRRSHRWGFATVHLGTHLPHIVLDATSNNSLGASTLPLSLDRAQRWELEGDFSRFFTLYAPKGYERDALYLFTPDVMARFVDNAAALDVEIVDDRLFLYSRRDLSTLDPDVWEWLFQTITAVTEKVAQWQRWRDDRLGETRVVVTPGGDTRIVRPPRGVAPRGRRLTEKLHWVWAVLGLIFFAIGVYAMFDEAFSPFGP